MNADHVRNLTTPVFTPSAWTAFGMTKTQPSYHFRAQLTTWHRINRGVDGLWEACRVGVSGCTADSVPAICSGE